jgi:hypothetical protein
MPHCLNGFVHIIIAEKQHPGNVFSTNLSTILEAYPQKSSKKVDKSAGNKKAPPVSRKSLQQIKQHYLPAR